MIPPAVSPLNHDWSQDDVAKTRLVGTEAVEVTDGQLDPKPGEGGERPDKIQPNRFDTKRPGINPFHFPWLLRTMLLKAYTGQNLF